MYMLSALRKFTRPCADNGTVVAYTTVNNSDITNLGSVVRVNVVKEGGGGGCGSRGFRYFLVQVE
jgi:hypothetical protein